MGAEVMPDGAVDDLNPRWRRVRPELARRCPGRGPAALCADLPALRPAELDLALAAAEGELAFVADADQRRHDLLDAPGT